LQADAQKTKTLIKIGGRTFLKRSALIFGGLDRVEYGFDANAATS
jgi:hypothetical protein